MNYLPKTEIISLRVVIAFLVLGCIAELVVCFNLILEGNAFYGVLAVGLWAPLALGLWFLHPLARSVTVGMLWLLVIVVPLGAINPFAAINDYGPNPPSALELSLRIYPLVAVAILVLHILGKYKSEFKPRS